ncbi:MAG: response regulator, partial [Acidobacteria bacterium]|nr:response regulator [Acidobacteriota bacterium]
MVNVLIVDDSEFSRRLLRKLLGTDPEIRVVGSAGSGYEALQFLENPPNRIKPDVIIMDIIMPGIDGFETTRMIMESNPTPIII